MPDRPEWMLTGLPALLLFGDIPADKNHDALFGAGKLPEVVQVLLLIPFAGIC